VAGWLDSSIHDFLEAFADVPDSTAYALVTCLDSQPNTASLLRRSPDLRSVARKCQLVGHAILLPTATLLEANAQTPLFTGFDEVWFFPNDTIEPKPDSAWLVGPNRISRSKLQVLGPWMRKNNCTLGLGDGEGLNVAVKGHEMARYLIAHSLSQPQHAVSGEAE
jgi:hypothetical protein